MNETQNKYAAVDCEFEWNKMRDILNMQEKNYKRKRKKKEIKFKELISLCSCRWCIYFREELSNINNLYWLYSGMSS